MNKQSFAGLVALIIFILFTVNCLATPDSPAAIEHEMKCWIKENQLITFRKSGNEIIFLSVSKDNTISSEKFSIIESDDKNAQYSIAVIDYNIILDFKNKKIHGQKKDENEEEFWYALADALVNLIFPNNKIGTQDIKEFHNALADALVNRRFACH